MEPQCIGWDDEIDLSMGSGMKRQGESHRCFIKPGAKTVNDPSRSMTILIGGEMLLTTGGIESEPPQKQVSR
jgi:hypothetical protein